jgi:hypothetical protein
MNLFADRNEQTQSTAHVKQAAIEHNSSKFEDCDISGASRNHLLKSPSYQQSYRDGDAHSQNGDAQSQGWSLTAAHQHRPQIDHQRHSSPPARTKLELEEKVAAQRELIATLKENCRLLERMQVTSLDDSKDASQRTRPSDPREFSRRASPSPAFGSTSAIPMAPHWPDPRGPDELARFAPSPTPTPPNTADRSADMLIVALTELVEQLEQLESAADAGTPTAVDPSFLAGTGSAWPPRAAARLQVAAAAAAAACHGGAMWGGGGV